MTDRRLYTVNEIFYSLQGEGCFTGTPAVFVRLSGCNRQCDFCDTDHHSGKRLTAEEIAAEAGTFAARHLVLTGGEPALQADDALIAALHAAGFYIQVETNGSLPLPAGIDWVTCSPKDGPWEIRHIDELKIVYQGDDTRLLDLAGRFEAKVRCAQPLSGGNIAETIDFCLRHPDWRLSLQTHKLIDIR